MQFTRFEMKSFSVIGREGSTDMGEGFVERLWSDANTHFSEIAALVLRDDSGAPVGFWGAMSDMSRSFMPWENGFSRGLYLAGAQVNDDAKAPDGWVKWTIPAYECIKVKADAPNVFKDTLAYLRENGMELAGAVNDFTDPKTGTWYMCFPIRKL